MRCDQIKATKVILSSPAIPTEGPLVDAWRIKEIREMYWETIRERSDCKVTRKVKVMG